VLALVLTGGVAGPASGDDVVRARATTHAQATAGVAAYWSAARMRAAEPLRLVLPARRPSAAAADPQDRPAFVPPVAPGAGGAPLLPGVGDASGSAFSPGDERALPNRLHGKVFATFHEIGDFSCSATAVNSPGRSLVISAGHCVFDPQTGEWAANWVFVPGYRDGKAPYGRWVARVLRSTDPWVSSENVSFDVGAASMSRNRNGRALGDVIGGRGIGFGQSRDRVYTSYGYPAEMPYDGESLQACRSPYRGDDPDTDPPRTMRITCDMTGGSSGGGWVSDGMQLSLNSYCTGLVLICLDNTSMYGPYFGDAVKKLYKRSRGSPPPKCAGRTVTQLGRARRDSLQGRRGSDTIRLGRGADKASGGRGNDRLCGGRGNDRLRGGPGFDRCVGGPGSDTAKSCERRRGIP
jgi:hypothetical protein